MAVVVSYVRRISANQHPSSTPNAHRLASRAETVETPKRKKKGTSAMAGTNG